MSAGDVMERVEQARGAIFDDDCKPFLRIGQPLVQQLAGKFCEEQVSRPEKTVIRLVFVVESLDAQEYRGADLRLIGAAVYENSPTHLELHESGADNRVMRPHGVVLEGTDEVACPGGNGRSR